MFSKRGEIVVHDRVNVQTPAQSRSTASAQFLQYDSSPCQRTAVGPCQWFACDANAIFSQIGAGDIQVSGAQSVTLHPTIPPPPFDPEYATVQVAGLNWASDDVVHVSAVGDAVAAFSATVTMPAPIHLTAPDLSGAGLFVPRTADLKVSWHDGTGQVSASIAGGGARIFEPVSLLRCVFSAADGSGVIPKEALSLLTAGGYGLSIVAADVHYAVVGDALITVSASAVDSQPGLPASGALTLQ
jgi:hypothetical protein